MNKLYILILIVLSNLKVSEIFGQGTCATAITIPTICIGSGGTVSGTVGSGTPVSTCTDGTGQVWFSFTVPSGRTTASLTISGYDCTGGGCKGNLVIFNSCGGSEVAANCGNSTNTMNGSFSLSPLVGGNTYYILIGSTGTLTGPISASISFSASTTPTGQAESEAITLTNGGAPISQSMCDADGVGSLSGADNCGSPYLYERWYTITPTGCSEAVINLTNVNANGGTLSVDIINRSNPGCNGTVGLYQRGAACIMVLVVR